MLYCRQLQIHFCDYKFITIITFEPGSKPVFTIVLFSKHTIRINTKTQIKLQNVILRNIVNCFMYILV